MTLYDEKNYVKEVTTAFSEKEAVNALRDAWKVLFSEYPSDRALAVLYAQSALETGRWKSIKNYNFGNLKQDFKANETNFTMFATGENIYNKTTKKMEWHWFEPPHIQTAFRAYDNAVDGAKDYIVFLSDRKSSEKWRNDAYKEAFGYLKLGQPELYSKALYKAGYYTANPETYTKGVVKLFNEFLSKKDTLIATPASEAITLPPPPEEEKTKVDVPHPHMVEQPVTPSKVIVLDEVTVKGDKPKGSAVIVGIVFAFIAGILKFLSII